MLILIRRPLRGHQAARVFFRSCDLMVLWSYGLLILCPIRLILLIYRARGGDKSTPSLPPRILSFQILGPQNRRFRIGGIAKLVKIEQISPEVLHFRKWSFLERLNKTTFTVAQQSTRNAYVCLFLQYLRSDWTISQIS